MAGEIEKRACRVRRGVHVCPSCAIFVVARRRAASLDSMAAGRAAPEAARERRRDVDVLSW